MAGIVDRAPAATHEIVVAMPVRKASPEDRIHLTPGQARALDLELEEIAEEEHREEEVPQQAAIGKRVSGWRTLLSFGIAALILIFAISKAGINWTATAHTLAHANVGLFALAFLMYYATFPIRTHRWRRLMHNANHGLLQRKIVHFPLWDLTQILYLSYFANVIIPAKLGDVYRAYLARRWLGVSLSRTVGTVLAERILDLVVLFPLLVTAAFLTFQASLFSAHEANIRLALLVGLGLAVSAGLLLVLLWRTGDSVLRVLPHRLGDIYAHFRYGAIRSFGRDTPALVGQTIVVWLLEGARLICILLALGLLAPGRVGLAAALFLALGSSVLGTLPLTPSGLGFVETFIVAVLVLLGVHGGKEAGAAVAVLDRMISYLSIAVFGFLVYLLTDKAHAAPAQQPPKPAAARSA
jgi:glycosyltransferase 2 family protein